MDGFLIDTANKAANEIRKPSIFYTVKFKNYLSKETGSVSPVANALGPGSDMEKYILAALVVPKSLFEPEFCTLLKASRNI